MSALKRIDRWLLWQKIINTAREVDKLAKGREIKLVVNYGFDDKDEEEDEDE